MSRVAWWLALVCLGGCGSGASDIIRPSAVRALECPEEHITVERIGKHRYRAQGCGKQVTYHCVDRPHFRASGATHAECTRLTPRPPHPAPPRARLPSPSR